MIARALVVWIVIAIAETIHGILRFRFLNRRLGDRRARQVTVFTGSLLIIGISSLFVAWLRIDSAADCITIGILWMCLMFAFDTLLGRFYFRFSWRRILEDFNPRKGGFLAFGMVVLLIAPWIAARLRGIPLV